MRNNLRLNMLRMSYQGIFLKNAFRSFLDIFATVQNLFRNPKPAVCSLGFIFLLFGSQSIFCQEVGNEIPVTDSSIREVIVAPLIGCPPPRRARVDHHISPDGRYALYGDLFGNGRICAFTEFDKGIGFCAWTSKRWEAKQSWDVPVEWDSPATAENRLGSVKAAKEAFATIKLNSTRRLVLVSSEVGKYHQDFYLIQYDDAKEVAGAVGKTMEPPYQRAGYLVLYNCSPRLAEWESWDFYRVAAGSLVHAAHWSSYQSVNNPDEHSTTARTYRGNGQSLDELDLRDAGSASDGFGYKITHTRKGASDSSVQFHWRKVKSLDPSTAEMEIRYLFTKLTGLPVELYPEEPSIKFTYTLKNLSNVSVTGDTDDITHLSFGKKKSAR